MGEKLKQQRNFNAVNVIVRPTTRNTKPKKLSFKEVSGADADCSDVCASSRQETGGMQIVIVSLSVGVAKKVMVWEQLSFSAGHCHFALKIFSRDIMMPKV